MCAARPVVRTLRRATRHLRVVSLALFVLATVVATNAFAQNPFVIDGVVPANGGSVPPVTQDPFGSVQELGPVNGSFTKVGVIHRATPPMLDFTNPNGQVDLRRVWIDTRKAPDGNQWLYFAWERDANSGSGFISIEFQKADLDPDCVYTGTGLDLVKPQTAAETALIQNCNPWAGRSAGDFLLLWDQNGSALTIVKRVFQMSGGQLVLGSPISLGTAVAAISTGTDAGFKGEAAINLTTDVFGGTNSCVNFANILPGTVTGNSDSADYKDTVLASFPDISNCGTLVVKKVTSPSNATAGVPSGGFGYSVNRADGSAVRYAPAAASISDALAEGGAATYTDTHVNLIAGSNYVVAEDALTTPWAYVSTACVLRAGAPDALQVGTVNGTGLTGVIIEPSAVTECTITNRLMQGTLRVIKLVTNDNGGTSTAGDFLMSVDLAQGSDVSFAGSVEGTSMTLTAGEGFEVTETGVAGYFQASTVGCKGTIADNVASVCTITNDDIAPSLKLVKQVVNDSGGTTKANAWTLSAAGPTSFSAVGVCKDAACNEASLQNPTTNGFDQGTYALSESGPSGYTAGNWVCTGTGVVQNGSSVTVDLGESAICTIVNNDSISTPTVVTAMSWVLKDTATISGMNTATLPAGESRGKIVFTLFLGTSCTGTPLHTEEVVNIATNGSYSTTNGKLLTQTDVGTGKTYSWIAHYTGDLFNQSFTTRCGEETHTITIVPVPAP